jgi:hypothetical protein
VVSRDQPGALAALCLVLHLHWACVPRSAACNLVIKALLSLNFGVPSQLSCFTSAPCLVVFSFSRNALAHVRVDPHHLGIICMLLLRVGANLTLGLCALQH